MYVTESKAIIAFVRRLSFALFGVLCSSLGLVSLLLGVALMFARDDKPGTASDAFTFILVKLIYSEIFIAFGITAVLIGLRYIFNRTGWFASTINKYWPKAMKYAMLAPAVVIVLGIVIRLIDLLV